MSQHSPDETVRRNTALEEWKSLRAETLQSQNQRFTAFQVSWILVGVLLTAYLTATNRLRGEPLLFESVILLLMMPFLHLITALRLRDYDQACYIGAFTSLQLPEIRHTLRNRGMPPDVRKATSSEQRMRRAYLLIAFGTSLVVLGVTSVGLPQQPWLILGYKVWGREIVFTLTWAGFLGTYVKGGYDRKLRKQIFEARFRTSIRELLTGQLLPAEWMASDRSKPEKWAEVFIWEDVSTQRFILNCLARYAAEIPHAKHIEQYLQARWQVQNAG